MVVACLRPKKSPQSAGKSEKISPQPKKVKALKTTKASGLWANLISTKIAIASSPKASVMVRSRPMWSETQPQKGRQTPFTSRSAESANCSAGMLRKRMLTGILSTLKSTAIGLSWATAIRPPVATSVIIRYISQNCGVADICQAVKSTADWRCFTTVPLGASFHACGSQPSGGEARKKAEITTTAPWMMPQRMKVA